jgi:RNA-directed DNA polymerase
MMHSTMGSDEWKAIHWKQVQKNVYRLQTRIFKAKRRGDTKQVHRLQKLLMKSRSAKLLAVRRVTQDNAGKKTAGTDGIKSLTPSQRLAMADSLSLTGKSKPTRRVMISKPGTKDEKRPLGIPCLIDRARQALAKLALEPEWEAVFEPNTFGFRPGRGVHDAIGAIFNGIRCKAKYVLESDIQKCFDKINHQALLKKLNTFPTLRRQIKAWLKAGVAEDGIVNPTEEGTPQGGVISPVLTLIALHGLETAIRNCIKQSRDEQHELIISIFADDFVVLNPSLEIILQCKTAIEEWLKGMSLELKPSKTHISHTLIPYEGKVGFDFLGFYIRQYSVGKHQSGKSANGRKLGFKTIIKPSKEKKARHIELLRNTIKAYRTAPQTALICKLNPTIRGWCNYYSTVCSKRTFTNCDNILWSQLRAWARYRTGNFSPKTLHKYWRYREGVLTFSTKDGKELISHSQRPIKRHIKVQGNRSYFDGDIIYWSTRKGQHPELPNRVATLLKKYKGRCPECGLMFAADDQIEGVRPLSDISSSNWKAILV